MLKLISIKPSKKLMALFSDGLIIFTSKMGYTHKEPVRRERYISRHRPRENWNKPSLEESIRDYKRIFNL